MVSFPEFCIIVKLIWSCNFQSFWQHTIPACLVVMPGRSGLLPANEYFIEVTKGIQGVDAEKDLASSLENLSTTQSSRSTKGRAGRF